MDDKALELIADLADELESEIYSRYCVMSVDDLGNPIIDDLGNPVWELSHPAYASRFKRDMITVNEARAFLKEMAA